MPRVLTIDELNFIIETSGIEDIVIKSWYKEFLKASPSGRMDKKHFYKFYKLLRGKSDEKLSKILDRLFASFDKDSNGYLDFSEFLIAYAATTNRETLKKLEFVFLFYDKDKDGTINVMEFLRGLQAICDFRGLSKKEYPPEQCIKDIFKKVDENGDKKLNKMEFINACLENNTIMTLLSPYEIE